MKQMWLSLGLSREGIWEAEETAGRRSKPERDGRMRADTRRLRAQARPCPVSAAALRSLGVSFKEEKEWFEVVLHLSKNHFSHFKKLPQRSNYEQRCEFFISTQDCVCPSRSNVQQVEKTPVSEAGYFVRENLVWALSESRFPQADELEAREDPT